MAGSPFRRTVKAFDERSPARPEGAGRPQLSFDPALKEILYEIDRLREEPPAEKELKDIQNFMRGTFVMTNSSRAGIFNILSNQDLHGLGPDYLSTYVQKIHALTPKGIQRAAQEYLKPDKMIIVVVGEKKEIADSLKGFGPVVE